MIRLDHVSKSYEVGKPALEDVTIHIDPGEFVFIVGDSGSGKSTLIRLLLKELEPTKGKIYINGQDLKKVTHKKVPMYRRNVGVVFQNFRLLPDRNVYENVAFAMKVVILLDILMAMSNVIVTSKNQLLIWKKSKLIKISYINL